MKNIMKIFEGSHGTSKTFSQSIIKSGFVKSEGRTGTGVYFWAKSSHFRNLAIGWYKHKCSKKGYSGTKSDKCAVIIAELSSNENEVLNLENEDLKEKIYQLSLRQNIDQNDNREIAALYNLFIYNLEKVLNVNFKVLMIKVAAPPGKFCPDYPIKIIGAPLCYVSRSVENIKIKDIEEVIL